MRRKTKHDSITYKALLQNCPEFEPDVDKVEICKGYDVMYQTDIRCKHR